MWRRFVNICEQGDLKKSCLRTFYFDVLCVFNIYGLPCVLTCETWLVLYFDYLFNHLSKAKLNNLQLICERYLLCGSMIDVESPNVSYKKWYFCVDGTHQWCKYESFKVVPKLKWSIRKRLVVRLCCVAMQWPLGRQWNVWNISCINHLLYTCILSNWK